MSLTPVNEIDPMVWNVGLPEYVDDSKIGLNVGRLHRFARMGCFSNDVQISSYDGDVTQYNPMIVGADAQGNAFAGVGKVKQARLGEGDFADIEQSMWAGFHSRPPLRLRVNTSEISQRMQQEKSQLRDPAAWSRHLNRALGEGLRGASWQHQVRNMQLGEVGYFAISQIFGIIDGDSLPELAGRAVFANNFSRLLGELLFSRGHTKREVARNMCWSMFPCTHPDRALLLSGVTRALPVVRSLK
jgi:hypothetical protein